MRRTGADRSAVSKLDVTMISVECYHLIEGVERVGGLSRELKGKDSTWGEERAVWAQGVVAFQMEPLAPPTPWRLSLCWASPPLRSASVRAVGGKAAGDIGVGGGGNGHSRWVKRRQRLPLS